MLRFPDSTPVEGIINMYRKVQGIEEQVETFLPREVRPEVIEKDIPLRIKIQKLRAEKVESLRDDLRDWLHKWSKYL